MSSGPDLTIPYVDAESGEQACFIVRRIPTGIGLCISARSSGDLEAIVPLAEASRIAAAIQMAITE